MLDTDLDPVSKNKIGKALLYGGIVVVVLGLIAAAAVGLTPSDPEQSRLANVPFGLLFCLGPALLGGIPCIIVGYGMSRRARNDDMGTLYRGF